MKLASTQWKNLIKNGTEPLFNSHFSLLTSHLDQFAIHAAELLKWNQKINLTAITDPEEVAVKHFIDSIAPMPMIPANARSLLDLGSGGGFPGIPLKILMPHLQVTLIDASRKKVNFQKHIIRTLHLKNIEAIHVRAEDFPVPKPELGNERGHMGFDVVICRAFSALDTFVSMALPLISENGVIIALKGKVSDTETESVYALNGISKDNFSMTVNTYTLPYLKAERSIILLSRR